jgi:hypothetical protein
MAIVEREAVMRCAAMLARMARLACLALAASLVACSIPFQPTATPITSAGDPSSAVPFYWTVQPEGSGGVLRVQGGNLHAIAGEVRVVDVAGKTVASTPTTLLGANDAGLCGSPQAQGMVGAELRLPDASKWPDQYRLQAKVGSAWRPAQLTKAC